MFGIFKTAATNLFEATLGASTESCSASVTSELLPTDETTTKTAAKTTTTTTKTIARPSEMGRAFRQPRHALTPASSENV